MNYYKRSSFELIAGSTSRGVHVGSMCTKRKGRNFIGLAVTGVRLDRKRLSSLSRVFLALPESELSQSKEQRCPKLSTTSVDTQNAEKPTKKAKSCCTRVVRQRELKRSVVWP